MESSRRRRAAFAVALCLAGPAVAGEVPPPDVLVSRQLLEQRGLAVGDVIALATDSGGREARAFRVAGALEPTPDPFRLARDRFEVRLHLPDMLALQEDPRDGRGADTVSWLNVALRRPDEAAAFARDVGRRIPGVTAFPTRGATRDPTFEALDRFHLAIALVTVLGSTMFLLALMVMRAEERRETAGILRLLGFARRRILLQALLEGVFITALGAVFGVAFAWVTQDVANRFFQWRYDTALVFVRVDAGIALRCVALAAPLGIVAGLLGAWPLLRRDVVALLRP